jgi:electron transport complex protein RnfG
MREMVIYTLTLGLIALLAGLILTGVYKSTKEAIDAAMRQDFLSGLVAVLPEFDNEPDADAIEINGQQVYVARKGGEVAGYAVSGLSKKGYGGDINVLVGVTPDGAVYGVQVVSHKETPGLGDKISQLPFLELFKNGNIDKNYSVKADGGDIDQFSGATISPRAVCEAVNKANAVLREVLQ